MDRNRPTRVCHLIGSTGLYGAERWILAQLSYLDAHKVQASIVNLVDRVAEPSAIVVEARKRGHVAMDFYTGGRFNPSAIYGVAQLFRKEGYHIVHTHGHKSDLVGLAAARLAKLKILSTPHGWSKEADLKLKIYETIGTFSLRLMDRVCPLSPELHQALRRRGVRESKISLIRNGVDLAEIASASRVEKPTLKKRIGFIGKLVESKGVLDLVDAFFLLNRVDCELFLLGDGPCLDRSRHRFRLAGQEQLLYCPGFVPNRLDYLKSFDVFVLPSHSEGTPRCVMEAQASEIPIVGTDIDGIRNLITHEHSGLLVPPKNPKALAEAINRILSSPELALNLVEESRKIVENRFSAAIMAKSYESLYGFLSPNAI
jgi:glycosyltransferase involved in cell wall biosynthesis